MTEKYLVEKVCGVSIDTILGHLCFSKQRICTPTLAFFTKTLSVLLHPLVSRFTGASPLRPPIKNPCVSKVKKSIDKISGKAKQGQYIDGQRSVCYILDKIFPKTLLII